jgi:hypothetical protein
MLRGQAVVDPRQGFAGSDSQDKSKPETEPKNGNHFGIHRCDGRSFCGRGSDTNLAVREQQQKANRRQAFLGVGITSSKQENHTKAPRSKEGLPGLISTEWKGFRRSVSTLPFPRPLFTCALREAIQSPSFF